MMNPRNLITICLHSIGGFEILLRKSEKKCKAMVEDVGSWVDFDSLYGILLLWKLYGNDWTVFFSVRDRRGWNDVAIEFKRKYFLDKTFRPATLQDFLDALFKLCVYCGVVKCARELVEGHYVNLEFINSFVDESHQFKYGFIQLALSVGVVKFRPIAYGSNRPKVREYLSQMSLRSFRLVVDDYQFRTENNGELSSMRHYIGGWKAGIDTLGTHFEDVWRMEDLQVESDASYCGYC